MARVKLASDEQFSNLRPTPLPNGEEEEGVYELEKILDHDTRRDMFYCKWKGFSEIYGSTWEPRAHIENTAGKLLDSYEKSIRTPGGGVKSVHPRPLDESKTGGRKKPRETIVKNENPFNPGWTTLRRKRFKAHLRTNVLKRGDVTRPSTNLV